jgi:hypothetical protein
MSAPDLVLLPVGDLARAGGWPEVRRAVQTALALHLLVAPGGRLAAEVEDAREVVRHVLQPSGQREARLPLGRLPLGLVVRALVALVEGVADGLHEIGSVVLEKA